MANQQYPTSKIEWNRRQDLSDDGHFGPLFRGTLKAKDGEDPTPVAVIRVDKSRNELLIDLERKLIGLNHPNVAKLLHVQDQNSFRFYAFEMWNASLDDVFGGRYSGPLPSPANVLVQLASGLKYIHENNLVHRDINPEKTLFSAKDRQMKWSGFALSSDTLKLHGITHSISSGSSAIIQTLAFLAPEIIRNYTRSHQDEQVDIQHTALSNVFAAGCVIAQFLTGGLHPFGDYRQDALKSDKEDSATFRTATGTAISHKIRAIADVRQNSHQYRNDHYEKERESRTNEDVFAHHPSSSARLDPFELNSQAVSNIHANNPINLRLLSAHYAYGFIRKMLESDPERREEGLNGLLDYITSTNKLETEFLDLCSVPEPTKEEINQLRRMIRYGDVVDINKSDEEGNTPLILFCRNRTGNNDLKESVKALMEDNKSQAVDVNKMNLKGYNALHYLSMNCKQHKPDLLMEIISLMSRHGANLNAKDATGATAIHYLCKNYKENSLIDLLNTFVQIGVDLGIVGPDGWTALHFVSRYYDHNNLMEVIHLLTERNPKLINSKTSDGWTALHYICRFHLEKDLIDIIRLLVGKGADMNCKTSTGYTALHYLCQCYPHENLVDIVRLLVDNQAEVSAQTKKGDTALEILQENYPDGDTKTEIVQLLLRSKRVPIIVTENEKRATENDAFRIKYDRNKVLGRGFFGVVFQGTFQDKEGEPPIVVAVKRIELFSDNLQVTEREFLLLKNLAHPNVVKLFHCETQPDFRCFALELCQASLEKMFLSENDPKKYDGPIPSPANVLIQLAEGLEYIHSKNLVHRDIKPENTLISATSHPVTVKWADFGLSKQVDSQGFYALSGIKGTQLYWPLETYEAFERAQKKGQLRNGYVVVAGDEKGTNLSDIFAAGCVFTEFLTGGKHPFGLQSDMKTNIEAGNPTELGLLSAHYAHDTIRLMLNNRPEKRQGMLRQLINTASSKIETEFFDLCSLPNPTEEEIKQLRRIVQFNQADVNQSDKFGFTPMILLCRSNRRGRNLLESIEALMSNKDQEVDLNKTDTKGYNSLLYICMNCGQHSTNFKEIVTLLVKKGINANATDDLGRNALYHLCRNYFRIDLIELVRILVDENADVNNVASDAGWTPFHLISRHYPNKNMIDLVRLLLEKGVDIHYKEPDGWTALHYLCRYYTHDNLIDIVRLLLEKGVDIHCKLPDGWTVLRVLCRYYTHDNLIDIVRLLVEKGVDEHYQEPDGWTALHHLCRYYTHDNLIEIVRLLVDKGVEVNCKNSDGWTPLHYLCRYYAHDNLINIVRLLADKGVDVNCKLPDGWTALHILCRYYTHDNLIEIIRLLVEKGVDVNWKNSIGGTALHYLCHHYTHDNLIDIARLLLEKGIDVQYKEPGGWTPLHCLCRNYTHEKLIDLVQLLVEEGIDVDCKILYELNEKMDIVTYNEENGWNAVHFLCRFYPQKNLIDILQLLKNQGADLKASCTEKEDPTDEGWTALHHLCHEYKQDNIVDVVRLFVEEGVNVNSKTSKGKTALMYLQDNFPDGDTKEVVVQFLLERTNC